MQTYATEGNILLAFFMVMLAILTIYLLNE